MNDRNPSNDKVDAVHMWEKYEKEIVGRGFYGKAFGL